MDYPPFEGAIEAGAGAGMCDINFINDINACQDNSTLNTEQNQKSYSVIKRKTENDI
jgi:hypothetical protein